MVYAPVISYMSEWFVNKRGMANGIVFSGGLTVRSGLSRAMVNVSCRSRSWRSTIPPHLTASHSTIRGNEDNKGVRDMHPDMLGPYPSTHESSPSRISCPRTSPSIVESPVAPEQKLLVLCRHEYHPKFGLLYTYDVASKYVSISRFVQ